MLTKNEGRDTFAFDAAAFDASAFEALVNETLVNEAFVDEALDNKALADEAADDEAAAEEGFSPPPNPTEGSDIKNTSSANRAYDRARPEECPTQRLFFHGCIGPHPSFVKNDKHIGDNWR
jgi:hypothetical protein